MKIRYILLLGLLAIVIFAVGAIWAEKKAWPYQWLADQNELAALMNKLVQPGPVIESTFSPLELKVINVGSELSIGSHESSFASHGGGIYAYDDKVLIVSVHGEFVLYQSVNGEGSVKKLNIDIDNGFDSFLDFEAKNKLPIGRAIKDFRFLDLIYHRQSSPPMLLVSHHQWHEDKECYTVRLSRLDLKADQPLETVSAKSADWQNVYDTTPCLPMKTKYHSFAGAISGGRIVLENSNSVLFSIGDHEFDGLNSIHIHAQDKSSDFGKIIRVDLSSGTASHVSIGHRNPQGLMIDKDSNIWSTEHGPRGGDELNIIRQDMNYGWPYVTYGSQYGEHRWPLSKNQNRHDGYARPVFAWVPSMPVSNLIQIKGFLPEWEDDLLVSSLGTKALHRIRYREGRVIFDEPIRVGSRIRDLDQLADGTIVLWTDDASIIEMKPVNSALPDIEHSIATLRGLKQQQARGTLESCQMCHSVSPRGGAEYAPNLWGVFGRKIAGTAFNGYSDGLKNKPGIWNEKTLDAFLKDVEGFSKDCNMTFPGISDDDIRFVTIEYLKTLNGNQDQTQRSTS